MAQTTDGRPAATPFQRLYDLLEPESSDLWTVFLFAIVTGVLYLATPLAVDAVVNNIAFGGEQQVYTQALLLVALGLFFVLILMAVIRGAQHFVVEVIQRRLFVRLTADLAYRLPRVRMEALDAKLSPELLNRFFDVITVQKTASMLLLDGLNLILGAVIGLAVLGFYHPFLLAFDFILVLVTAAIIFGFGRGAVSTSVDESYAKHAVAGWLEQVAMYPYTFKTGGAFRLACSQADELAGEYLAARKEHFRIVIRQIGGLLALQAVANASLLAVGGFLVLQGELTLGQLVASEIIVSAVVASLASLGKHVESLYDALASVDKIGYVVDLPIEREGGDPPPPVDPRGTSLEVSDLRFGYDANRPLLNHLEFTVEPGEVVALEAPAGYGSSTVFDLIMGAREPQQGSLEVDGLDLRLWDLQLLRKRVLLVRGADVLRGSVLENVRLGREDLNLRDVQDALEAVGLMETVSRLPQGLNTPLQVGGMPLSSSQRTRLMVARALAGRPKLLLLDEALDNLDPETLRDLTRHLFDRKQPWSVLVATNERTVLDQCDKIVNLADFQARPAFARTEGA